MAFPQTSVTLKPAAAFAGMMSDMSQLKDAKSYVNEEASTEIAFGVIVKQGTDNDQMKIFAAQADKALGILVHSHYYNKSNELGTIGLKPKVVGSVLTRGRAFVTVDEAVSPADAVRFRASGAGVGTFRKTASAGVTVNMTPSARWLSTTTGAGVAELEFDVLDRAAWTND